MLSDIVRTCKCPQSMHNQHRSPCASYSTAHCSTPPPRRMPPRKAASDSWQRQHRASTSTTRASSIGAVVDVAEAIRRRRVEKVSCVALTRPREGRRALAESRHGKSHQILAVCPIFPIHMSAFRTPLTRTYKGVFAHPIWGLRTSNREGFVLGGFRA